jgi:hypothetical protein
MDIITVPLRMRLSMQCFIQFDVFRCFIALQACDVCLQAWRLDVPYCRGQLESRDPKMQSDDKKITSSF